MGPEGAPATCAGLGQGPAWCMPPCTLAAPRPALQLHGYSQPRVGASKVRGAGCRGAQGLTLPFFLLAAKKPTPQALLVRLLVSSGAPGQELFWPGAGGDAGAGMLLLAAPRRRQRVPACPSPRAGDPAPSLGLEARGGRRRGRVELPRGRSRVPGGRSDPVSLCPRLGGGGL